MPYDRIVVNHAYVFSELQRDLNSCIAEGRNCADALPHYYLLSARGIQNVLRTGFEPA